MVSGVTSIKISSNSTVLHSRTSHGIPSPLGNINTKANDQRCSRAYPEQEREALPIVLRLVDDRLDDTRPDRGRRAVGKTEQAKELRVYRSTPGGRRPQQTTYHVVKPQWTQLSDHRLRKGMVRCLEQTVVGPKLPGIINLWEGSVMYSDKWICGHNAP
jgi:hypothetical protein